jgi:hypothetical protein
MQVVYQSEDGWFILVLQLLHNMLNVLSDELETGTHYKWTFEFRKGLNNLLEMAIEEGVDFQE